MGKEKHEVKRMSGGCLMLVVLSGLLVEWAHAHAHAHAGGGSVPVPGRSVPPVRIFQLYSHWCAPTHRAAAILSRLSNVVESVDASEMAASNLYNSLYMAVGDMDIRKLMGKWFTVVDTPGIHPQHCSVFYFELLDQTPYTATFTVRHYFRNAEKMEILEGYGRKMGPDPAELLINIGHPADPCPYSVICCGPTNDNEQYDYLILTQPLKYPTIVLARDPVHFDKQQVEKFLENYQPFWNPSLPFKNTLLFLNTTDCFGTDQYNMGL